MRIAPLLAILAAVGCGRSHPAQPPSDLEHTVAVLVPNNRTGDHLLVAGTSFIEKYAFASSRVTVPDVLASEARLQLARRGFTVVDKDVVEKATEGKTPGSAEAAAEIASHGKLPGLALWLDIRRWEPDAPTHPAFVIVAVTASLVEPATGKVKWSVDRPAAPVPTPGEIALGPAYVTAARKVAHELFASLGEEQPIAVDHHRRRR